MMFKSNSSNRSFSELATQLHNFASKKNQSFKTKVKSSEFLEKSKKLIQLLYFKTFKRSKKSKSENFPIMKISASREAVETRQAYPDIDNVIRGIILTRSQNGATIEEIKCKL